MMKAKVSRVKVTLTLEKRQGRIFKHDPKDDHIIKKVREVYFKREAMD